MDNANRILYNDIQIPFWIRITYVAIGLAIVAVNIPVILAFMQDKAIRRVPANFIILNLSCIDMVKGLALLVQYFWVIYGDEVPTRGSIICAFARSLQYSLRTVSVLTVVHMSWDRLRMVSYPFEYRLRTRRQTMWISCLMIIYAAVYILVVFIISAGEAAHLDGTPCTVTNLPTAFVYSSLVMDFAIPLTLLITLNVLVVRAIRAANFDKFHRISISGRSRGTSITRYHEDPTRSGGSTHEVSSISRTVVENTTICGTGVELQEPDRPTSGLAIHSEMRLSPSAERELARIKRVTSRLKIFVLVFVINWLPYHLTVFWNLYTHIPDSVVMASALNYALNSFINPFMYAFMSEKFRHRLGIMFDGLKGFPRTIMIRANIIED